MAWARYLPRVGALEMFVILVTSGYKIRIQADASSHVFFPRYFLSRFEK